MTGVQRYPTPVPSGGDVDGPASATDNALARYDGTTGKLLQDSSVSVTDAGKLQLIASGSASAGINIAPGSAPSSPVNGDIWTTTSGVYARINGVTQGPFESAAGSYQPASGDLTAIDALAGTSGFLKKTGTDTWTLDTNTYITGNQTITLSGDASGSGTTAITVTVADDSHSHTGATISGLDAADTTTGTFDIARIPTGSTGTTVALGNHTHSYLSSSTSSTQDGYFGDIYLYDDSTPSHYLRITNSANLTLARVLNINVNDADRTVSLSGNLTVPSAATVSGTNTGDQTITLTGNVTGSGTGSFAATIANDAVTYAKMQNVSAQYRVLGRITAAAGDVEELTGENLVTVLGQATSKTGSGSIVFHTAPTFSGTVTATTFSGSGASLTSIPQSAVTNLTTDLSGKQPLDADLTAIAALAGTSGLLKKTAADTWTLDTTAYTTNTGTVTSVGMTVPTGLSISGSPITTSGTLALTLTSGYSIPTTASQTNWDTAYTDRNKWDGGATGLNAATGRTSLGGTTVGQNLFTLTNPTAVTFLRINADNTVSTLDAATFRSAIGAGTSSTTGTVTSVGMTVPTGLSISGSPVTTSGTLAMTLTAGYEIPTTAALAAKAPLASPTFTGTVTAATLDLTTAATATAATSYWVETGSDGILRPKTLANTRTEIVTTAAVNAAAATTVGTITSGTWQGTAINAAYIDSAIARLASPTFTGKVTTAASATGGAGFSLPHGAAPTSPVNGDVWTTTAGMYARINGSTVGPFAAASGGATWGSITGTLSSQTDLQTALDAKAPTASPTFTGTVTTDGIAAGAPGTFNSFVSGSTATIPSILDGSFLANRDSHTIIYLLAHGSSGVAARIRGWVAGGTSSARTVPTASSLLLSIDARGWGGTGYRGGSAIEFSLGTGTFSDTSMPGKIEFQTVPDGAISRQTRMTIDQNGLATFANDVLVSGTSKLYLGNATGGYKGEIRSQSNYPIVLMPYDNSGAALSGAEFYYSTGGNTWNSEVGLNVSGALGITNSSGANSISLSSTDGDALVNVQAGGASGNYGYLRLRSKWGQASQNELHTGLASDGSWFVSQKTVNGSSVSRDNLLNVTPGGEIGLNPVNSVQINGRLIFPSTKSIRLRAGNVSTGTDEYELMGYSDGNLWLSYNNPFGTFVRDLAMFKPDGTFHLAQPGYGIEYGSAGPRHMVGSSDPTGIDVPVGSTWRQTSANSTYGNLTGLLWNKVGTGTTLGTDWLVDFEGRWITYTVTTTNVTIGTGGTVTGKYTRTGKTITCRVRLVLGTSGSFSGTVALSLPATGASLADTVYAGNVIMRDSGVSANWGLVSIGNNATTFGIAYAAGTQPAIGNSVGSGSTPFTWGNADNFHAQFTYESA